KCCSAGADALGVGGREAWRCLELQARTEFGIRAAEGLAGDGQEEIDVIADAEDVGTGAGVQAQGAAGPRTGGQIAPPDGGKGELMNAVGCRVAVECPEIDVSG